MVEGYSLMLSISFTLILLEIGLIFPCGDEKGGGIKDDSEADDDDNDEDGSELVEGSDKRTNRPWVIFRTSYTM